MTTLYDSSTAYDSNITYSGGVRPSVYDDVVPSQDEGEIYNRVIITRTGGTAQTAEDLTSKTQYFIRDLTQSDLPLLSDADSFVRAQFLLSRYKDPQARFDVLEVDARVDGTFDLLLNLELGDIIRVKRFTL